MNPLSKITGFRLRCLFWLCIISALLNGCARKVPLRDNVIKEPLPWCFDVSFELGEKKDHKARVCYESLAVCNRALRDARRYGNLIKLNGITDCEERR